MVLKKHYVVVLDPIKSSPSKAISLAIQSLPDVSEPYACVDTRSIPSESKGQDHEDMALAADPSRNAQGGAVHCGPRANPQAKNATAMAVISACFLAPGVKDLMCPRAVGARR